MGEQKIIHADFASRFLGKIDVMDVGPFIREIFRQHRESPLHVLFEHEVRIKHNADVAALQCDIRPICRAAPGIHTQQGQHAGFVRDQRISFFCPSVIHKNVWDHAREHGSGDGSPGAAASPSG